MTVLKHTASLSFLLPKFNVCNGWKNFHQNTCMSPEQHILILVTKLCVIEILGEEVYNNQNNLKPNNRNRRADEALVDRVNHVNGVRGNLNISIT